MINVYRSILRKLLRIELRRISKDYPIDLDDLISYYDMMAIFSLENHRILGTSLQAVKYLEELKDLRKKK